MGRLAIEGFDQSVPLGEKGLVRSGDVDEATTYKVAPQEARLEEFESDNDLRSQAIFLTFESGWRSLDKNMVDGVKDSTTYVGSIDTLRAACDQV